MSFGNCGTLSTVPALQSLSALSVEGALVRTTFPGCCGRLEVSRVPGRLVTRGLGAWAGERRERSGLHCSQAWPSTDLSQAEQGSCSHPGASCPTLHVSNESQSSSAARGLVLLTGQSSLL